MITHLSGVADSEQLAELTKLLEAYAKEVGVDADKAARDRLALRIMALFNEGVVRPEDIRRELDSSPSTWLIEPVPT